MELRNLTENSEEQSSGNPGGGSMVFDLLPLGRVFPNPRQPRKVFDQGAILELAQSIKANGVLQPILVRRRGEGFQIVSGERRFQACKIAGLSHIPAVMRDMGDSETLLAGLIENIQREELNPVEEARAFREIILNYGMTHDLLAQRLGRSRSALTNRLRILQLPGSVQQLIVSGMLSAGHAKILAGLPDPGQTEAWANRIIEGGWSVYETEKQVANMKEGSRDNSRKKVLHQKVRNSENSADIHIRRTEENLQELLGAKVRIRRGRQRSRIEIEFYDEADLERVIERLVPGM